MKLSWIYRSLQASVLASAALTMLPVGAQTPAPDTSAPTAAAAAQATPATPRMQKQSQRAQQRSQRHTPASKRGQRTGSGEPANADRLATDRGASAADFERNAMARCEVFKMPEESKACRDRMRQTPRGSVQDGGFLREYSYEVPAKGS